jgi:hypothetical protein
LRLDQRGGEDSGGKSETAKTESKTEKKAAEAS